VKSPVAGSPTLRHDDKSVHLTSSPRRSSLMLIPGRNVSVGWSKLCHTGRLLRAPASVAQGQHDVPVVRDGERDVPHGRGGGQGRVGAPHDAAALQHRPAVQLARSPDRSGVGRRGAHGRVRVAVGGHPTTAPAIAPP
jgi:hypothetical protein